MDQSREQKADEPETASATEKPREVHLIFPKNLSCIFAQDMDLQGGHISSCDHKDRKRNIFEKCLHSEQLKPNIFEVNHLTKYDYFNDADIFQVRLFELFNRLCSTPLLNVVL